jgi:hypothetical protein
MINPSWSRLDKVLEPRARGKAKRLVADSASRFGCPNVCVRFLGSRVQALEFLFEFLQLFVGKIFKIDKFITRTFKGPDQLV